MTRALAIVAVSSLLLIACGDGKPTEAVTLVPSALVGTWTVQLVPPTDTPYVGCTFVATFAADGTYGAGTLCDVLVLGAGPPAPPDLRTEVQWATGAFTAAPSGRINFLPSEWECAGGPLVTYGEYAGPASRPTITMAPPYQAYVLAPSVAMPVPAGAIHGCFASDWTFAPSSIP